MNIKIFQNQISKVVLFLITLFTFVQCGHSNSSGESVYDKYEGRYKYPNGLMLIVKAKDQKLYARLSDQPEYEINEVKKDYFEWAVVDSNVTFHRNAENKIDSVTHVQGELVIKAPRMEDQLVVTLTKEVLDKYVGTFSGAMGVIESSIEDGKLFLQLQGRQKFEIFPTSDNSFFLEVVDATIVFNESEDGGMSMLFTQNGNPMIFYRQ